jgi:hypothetical protein
MACNSFPTHVVGFCDHALFLCYSMVHASNNASWDTRHDPFQVPAYQSSSLVQGRQIKQMTWRTQWIGHARYSLCHMIEVVTV